MQTARYVDQSIEVLGIESPRLSMLDPNLDHSRHIIEAFFHVNQKLLELMPKMQLLQDDLSRSRDDEKLIRSSRDRLKNELEKSKQEATVAAEAQRQSNLKIKKLSKELQTAKKEVEKLRLEKQGLATHYEHKNKRQEQEQIKLKARLDTLISKTEKSKNLGITAMNKLDSKNGKRGKWANPSRADEDLSRMNVEKREDLIKELQLENKELRESLAVMESQFTDLLSTSGNGGADQSPKRLTNADTAISPKSSQPSPLKSGHFELPFATSRDGIERSLKLKMDELKERVVQLKAQAGATGTADQDVVANLQEQVKEYADLVERQRQALFESSSPPSPSKSFLSDSFIHEKADALRQEQELLDEKRQNIENERELFLRAARKLDQDRAKIEAAKIQLPMTPIQNQAASLTGNVKKGSSLSHMQSITKPSFLPETPEAFSIRPTEPNALTGTGSLDLLRYLQTSTPT